MSANERGQCPPHGTRPPEPSDQALRELHRVDAGDFSTAGEASASIKRVLRRMGIDPDVIRRVSVASYEVEINLVIHSFGGTMEMILDGDWLTIVSRDTGPGIEDVSLAMTEGWSTATEEVREKGFGAGMGLPNVKRNTDYFDIVSRAGVGTTMRMGFKIQ
ncbi:MAG: ATP-binding protein [Oscillospiraceae bacterium]|jgi:anti-sigma regulatory factor (Ser/Thr protein kinase)|nr:ATP-binding protein [Oscillospiraceae bacterium]